MASSVTASAAGALCVCCFVGERGFFKKVLQQQAIGQEVERVSVNYHNLVSAVCLQT